MSVFQDVGRDIPSAARGRSVFVGARGKEAGPKTSVIEPRCAGWLPRSRMCVRGGSCLTVGVGRTGRPQSVRREVLRRCPTPTRARRRAAAAAGVGGDPHSRRRLLAVSTPTKTSLCCAVSRLVLPSRGWTRPYGQPSRPARCGTSHPTQAADMRTYGRGRVMALYRLRRSASSATSKRALVRAGLHRWQDLLGSVDIQRSQRTVAASVTTAR